MHNTRTWNPSESVKTMNPPTKRYTCTCHPEINPWTFKQPVIKNPDNRKYSNMANNSQTIKEYKLYQSVTKNLPRVIQYTKWKVLKTCSKKMNDNSFVKSTIFHLLKNLKAGHRMLPNWLVNFALMNKSQTSNNRSKTKQQCEATKINILAIIVPDVNTSFK